MTNAAAPATSGAWWRAGVIYQIYPRSFQDSGGDGVGDLEGIRRRLDYLVSLGVDAIWISPFYPSPMHDFGYDVSNYCDVDPIFGSLQDFDLLLADAHWRGLKIVLDFVPNHTSIEHEWFEASRQRRDDKSDWYIWRDGASSGGPPNNWRSHFGGPAWSFDPVRGQYYYHAFLPQQPDLNWRNPNVKAAMFDVLRFWLRRGVDGFRVDVISQLMKDEALRDNPVNPHWTPLRPQIEELEQLYSGDQADIHPLIAEMRGVLAEYGDPLLIGEIYLPVERLVAYYGAALSGAHLPFNFQLLETRWEAESLGAMIASYEALLPEGAWPNWVLSNHDRPRVATRVDAQARVATMLLLTLRGTPTLYYGDELGIGHVDIPPPRIRDPWALREPSLPVGRDSVRTPMQWNRSANAGFSTGEPWLPLTPDWSERNVERFEKDPASLLNLTRMLLDYRRAHRSLSLGSWRLVESGSDVLVFERRSGEERTIVALNLGAAPRLRRLDSIGSSFRVAISTYCDRTGETFDQELGLRPDEGVVIEVLG
ncbi:alpha-amylase family glycosyl hydrolase [Methylocella silvestris]|uniref:Alpha-amylase n=1 Tax=Methylocella silvestris TaxID=199596 RepID=A0A2J7TKP6_METSI|nr:alpha-amylase family glycosyl hydrolase [Methylocella silvestris]PNG27351.1 alpha-amylase [Methylocella silvestris]